jgi:hypothetical protein
MAPAFQLRGGVAEFGGVTLPAQEAARMNRAAWRQAPHGFAMGTPQGSESSGVRAEVK